VTKNQHKAQGDALTQLIATVGEGALQGVVTGLAQGAFSSAEAGQLARAAVQGVSQEAAAQGADVATVFTRVAIAAASTAAALAPAHAGEIARQVANVQVAIPAGLGG
jgi:hypothetical protein